MRVLLPSEIMKARSLPVGSIRKWGNVSYRKEGDGKWVEVKKEGSDKKERKQLIGAATSFEETYSNWYKQNPYEFRNQLADHLKKVNPEKYKGEEDIPQSPALVERLAEKHKLPYKPSKFPTGWGKLSIKEKLSENKNRALYEISYAIAGTKDASKEVSHTKVYEEYKKIKDLRNKELVKVGNDAIEFYNERKGHPDMIRPKIEYA